MSEIELKLLIDAGEARLIWSRLAASGLARTPRLTRTLRSIYFDTPDLALGKASIALRLRRTGRRWVQTVKIGAKLHQGLSRTEELESAAPGGMPNLTAISDQSAREEIIRRVNGKQLGPVSETIIRRTACIVTFDDCTQVELATDFGTIKAGERSADHREVEIELIAGNAPRLFDLVRTILPHGGLAFSRFSKSARASMLAAKGYIEPPLAPIFASQVEIAPALNVEQAARAMLGECLDQLAANVVVVRNLDLTEGPHQLRVGLRRLRSVFLIFCAVHECPELASLQDEARWLGAEVGRLRNLDVLAQDIAAKEAKANPQVTGLHELANVLVAMASAERRTLRDTLTSARTQTFLIDLACFIETRGWLVPQDFSQTTRLSVPVAEFATKAINDQWRKVVKRSKRLAELDTIQRHELRKELKKLRYATEFLSPFFPRKRTGPFVKRLKALQDVFGFLNDAALTIATLGESDLPSLRKPALQRAIGWTIGASQSRAEFAWRDAKTLWRDLEYSRQYWK